MTLRDFAPSDLQAVLALNMQATDPHADIGASLRHYPDLLDIPECFQRGGAFLVGVVADEVVAMGAVERLTSDTFGVRYMRVAIPCQRRGCGRALLNALEERASQLGARTLVLDTTVQQLPAQRLYESAGFAETHRSIVRNLDGAEFQLINYRKVLPVEPMA